MGCCWQPGGAHYDEEPHRSQGDILTDYLCEAVGKLSEAAIAECSADLQRWIERHREDDAKRIAEERAQAERHVKKELAMKKLTLEERQILGVRE